MDLRFMTWDGMASRPALVWSTYTRPYQFPSLHSTMTILLLLQVPDIKTDSFTTSILLHQFTVPSELPADSCEEYTDSFHLTDLLVHYSDVGEAGIVESSDSVSDIPIDGTCTGALSTSYHVDVDGESDTLQVVSLISGFELSRGPSPSCPPPPPSPSPSCPRPPVL